MWAMWRVEYGLNAPKGDSGCFRPLLLDGGGRTILVTHRASTALPVAPMTSASVKVAHHKLSGSHVDNMEGRVRP